MDNHELYALKVILSAFVGQLIDLQQGFLNEIVIKKGKDADLLKDIIEIQIAKIEADLKKDIRQV